MNNIEEYQNLIELLKKALEFYADTNNYHGAMGTVAMIDLDEHGSQARFALNKIKEMTDTKDKMEADFVKNMGEAIENNESTDNMLKIIEEFKNLGNADNNI